MILDTYRKEKIIPAFIVVSTIALVMLAFSKTLPVFTPMGMLWGAGARISLSCIYDIRP
jgi:hypothetical protein